MVTLFDGNIINIALSDGYFRINWNKEQWLLKMNEEKS